LAWQVKKCIENTLKLREIFALTACLACKIHNVDEISVILQKKELIKCSQARVYVK
jgi:hypothetical protein